MPPNLRVIHSYGVAIPMALPYTLPMHSVRETPIFTRRADALLSRQERFDLISLLANKPLAGEEIPGLGGVRKLRFAGGGRASAARSAWSTTC